MMTTRAISIACSGRLVVVLSTATATATAIAVVMMRTSFRRRLKTAAAAPTMAPAAGGASKAHASAAGAASANEVDHSKCSGLSRWCFIVLPVSVLLGVLSDFRAVNFGVVLCVLASSEFSRTDGPS